MLDELNFHPVGAPNSEANVKFGLQISVPKGLQWDASTTRTLVGPPWEKWILDYCEFPDKNYEHI